MNSVKIACFAICFLLTVVSSVAFAQESPQVFKVKSVHSENFDTESAQNLRRLTRIANRDGKVMVWIVTSAPFDARVDPMSDSYTAQLEVLDRYRERIAKSLGLQKLDIQSVTDGPFFAADLDSKQLRILFRLRAVKGFWGFTNAGYVSSD